MTRLQTLYKCIQKLNDENPLNHSCLSDSNKFQQYLEELCEGLPPKSCIVMDNASYHCKLVSLQCSKSKQSFVLGEIETFRKIR